MTKSGTWVGQTTQNAWGLSWKWQRKAGLFRKPPSSSSHPSAGSAISQLLDVLITSLAIEHQSASCMGRWHRHGHRRCIKKAVLEITFTEGLLSAQRDSRGEMCMSRNANGRREDFPRRDPTQQWLCVFCHHLCCTCGSPPPSQAPSTQLPKHPSSSHPCSQL